MFTHQNPIRTHITYTHFRHPTSPNTRIHTHTAISTPTFTRTQILHTHTHTPTVAHICTNTDAQVLRHTATSTASWLHAQPHTLTDTVTHSDVRRVTSTAAQTQRCSLTAAPPQWSTPLGLLPLLSETVLHPPRKEASSAGTVNPLWWLEGSENLKPPPSEFSTQGGGPVARDSQTPHCCADSESLAKPQPPPSVSGWGGSKRARY